MSLLDCLNSTKRECDIFLEDIRKGINDPSYILTDLFKNNNQSLELLLFAINKYGDFSPEQLQQELFDRLIPYLSRFILEQEVSFEYNKETFGSFIALRFEEKQIFFIDIYNGQYIVKENEEIDKLDYELGAIDKEIDSINAQIKEKHMLYENPLLLGGANIFKIADICVKKDKYKKNVLKEINDLNSQISKLNEMKNNIFIKKENSSNNFLQIASIQERLITKFKRIGYVEKKE